MAGKSLSAGPPGRKNGSENSRAGCVQSNSRRTPNAFASAIAASGCNGNVLVQ
jgi:hypothetical protein